MEHNNSLCSGCGEHNPREGQRYCHQCHAASMRRYRARQRQAINKKVQAAAARAYKAGFENGQLST